jgi:hypothetical protein
MTGEQDTDSKQYMSRTSRALITRSRFEMDMRLEHVGKMLGTFLENELSDAHLGLSAPARAHLDKFRSFLFSYYIAKFGYYPPASSTGTSTAFPKSVYAQMCQEFQKLYDFLVDPEFSSSDASQSSQLGGMCVLQSVQAFDSRHKYSAQLHPLPLLPEGQDSPLTKSSISKRMSWFPKTDKMKPDPRLITFSSLTKATNCTDKSLLACSLVRAYRGFEKDCIFSPTKGDKSDRLSHTDARKVRWILIYGVLQTLLSATRIPKEVRDTQNVSYDLCVLTAGCPPWKESPLDSPLPLSQNEQLKEDVMDAGSNPPSYTGSAASSPSEIKPDIDYFAINHRPREERSQSARPFSMYSVGSFGKSTTRKGTVRRALSTLGNMPELSHPSPKRPIYHEILVHGYGNGTNTVNITTSNSPPVEEKDEENYRCHKKQDSDASAAGIFSGWSKSSFDDLDSPGLSTSSSARTSDSSDSIQEFLDSPISSHDLVNVARSDYSDSVYEGLEPDPLQVKKYNTEGFMRVTTEKKVEYGETIDKDANPELAAYLNA